MSKPKKFYPSSAAFMVGDSVMTKYDSGCLRSILIKANGVRTGDIHPVYKRVGAAHEARFAEELRNDPRVLTFQAEKPVKKMLTEDVEYSGRMDFKAFLKNSQDEPIIYETKGTVSKNTRRDNRKGPNVSYLAQLVSYMIDERTHRGKLVCGYYEEDDAGQLVEQERVEFKVTISDTGRVDVNGEPSGFNAMDLLAHRKAAADVISKHEVGPRPDKWNQTWGGPCSSCAFKKVCELWDQGAIQDGTDGFLGQARVCAEVAKQTEGHTPVVNKVRVKKTKGATDDGDES